MDSSEADSADGPGAFSFHPPASEEAERSPIVELWYELTEHLKDQDVPHPSEFRAEKVRIIRCDFPLDWHTGLGLSLCYGCVLA